MPFLLLISPPSSFSSFVQPPPYKVRPLLSQSHFSFIHLKMSSPPPSPPIQPPAPALLRLPAWELPPPYPTTPASLNLARSPSTTSIATLAPPPKYTPSLALDVPPPYALGDRVVGTLVAACRIVMARIIANTHRSSGSIRDIEMGLYAEEWVREGARRQGSSRRCCGPDRLSTVLISLFFFGGFAGIVGWVLFHLAARGVFR